MESMQPTETKNPIRTDLPGSLSKPSSSSTEQIWLKYPGGLPGIQRESAETAHCI